jgi:hypothetical protein
MYCLIVLLFFLQFLTNAKDLVSSSYVTLKPTLMIPNNFIYVYVDLTLREKYWIQFCMAFYEFS